MKGVGLASQAGQGKAQQRSLLGSGSLEWETYTHPLPNLLAWDVYVCVYMHIDVCVYIYMYIYLSIISVFCMKAWTFTNIISRST